MTTALYTSFADSPEAFYCKATFEEIKQALPHFINENHQEALAGWPHIFWPDANCWIVLAETLEEAQAVMLLRWLTTEVRFSQLEVDEFQSYITDARILYRKIQLKPIEEWAAYFALVPIYSK